MATIKDVAKMAGVSIATVSNVLHGKVTVNSEIVARVHRIIDELNYHPSMLASNLRSAKIMFIGVVVPSIDTIYSQIIEGILKYFESIDIHIVIKKTNDFQNVEAQAIDDLINMGAKGIILVTCNAAGSTIFEKARAAGIRLLFVMRKTADKSFSSITFDNRLSVYLSLIHIFCPSLYSYVLQRSFINLAIFDIRKRHYYIALNKYVFLVVIMVFQL